MIDAKELRIGNWVQNDAGIEWQFKDFDELADQYSKYGNTESRIEPFPIPLTPDIFFENLGFAGKYKSVGYHFTKNGVNLGSQDEDDYGNPIKDYVFHVYYNYSGPPIYYLHQLQNLYFSLTQTELNYKP